MDYFENFISYRRANHKVEAQKLYKRLTDMGHSVFWDYEAINIGKFDDKIVDAINTCKNFIVLTSREALTPCAKPNDWVYREIKEALDSRKNIVLLFVNEEVSFPSNLPSELDELKRYNGIPFFDVDNYSQLDQLVSRFLNYSHIVSRKTDFIMDGDTLLKYVGKAPIVEVPPTCKKIGEKAFAERTDLLDISFSEGLEEIGVSAFERCRSLKALVFPPSLISIKKSAFRRCVGLHSIQTNPSLVSIEALAFEFCSELTNILIGASVKKIDSSAFNNCSSLKRIDVNKANCYFSSRSGVLYSKDLCKIIRCPEGARQVQFPDEVRSIGPYCFYKSSIRSLHIQNDVENIGPFAFQQSGICKISYLGKKKPIIDNYAFADCSCLENNPFVDNQQQNEFINKQRNVKNELFQYGYVTVATTFESEEDARNMSSMLLEKRLIVAAQLKSIRSLYYWDEDICDEKETELVCITEGRLYQSVERFILQNHPYDLPEVICTPIINTTSDYGNWISGYVRRN